MMAGRRSAMMMVGRWSVTGDDVGRETKCER